MRGLKAPAAAGSGSERLRELLLSELTHLRFRLLQPVRHVHFAVHR
jgi:hypothetical protein